jgi:glycosyltransferase involved in cell wall biosynthesis
LRVGTTTDAYGFRSGTRNIFPVMPEPSPVDVLLVSPGTTEGWRRGDRELAELLEELGLSTATATTDFRLVGRFRRGMLATDLIEAAAMRRVLTRALRRHRPRAIVYSSPQATMLQPRRRLSGATAVRFDEPAVSNRIGRGTRLLHNLERRALKRVRLLLPLGIEPSAEARMLDLDIPMVALPVAIPVSPEPWRTRERIALVYAGNPAKKGLELAAAAWTRSAAPGWRLVVTGIDHRRGVRHLARHGVPEPPAVEWTGLLPAERYRELLGSATVFVSASRHEDYGLAQLEALGNGLALVTLAAVGPYPALEIARAADSRLVAAEASAEALSASLEAGLALTDAERAAYAARSAEKLRLHSRDELERRLKEQVLPVLLASA